MPDEGEGIALILGDREVRDGAQALTDRVDHVPQRHRVRAGSQTDEAIGGRDPRYRVTVVETKRQIHAHIDRSRYSFDETNHVRMRTIHGHALSDAYRARRRI